MGSSQTTVAHRYEVTCKNGKRITLPETNIAHENRNFSWEIPSKLGIFMGYVSLPEGNCITVVGFLICRAYQGRSS